jgi:type I restriction enzyme S subunit
MLDSGKQESEEGEAKPYLRAANIHWGRILLDDVNEMKFSKQQLERYALQSGDLLVTEGGVTVGRSAIWRGELDECYYQNSLNRARTKGKASTEYLYFWMYFLTKNGYIELVAEKATFGHLTKEKLEVLPMTIPSLDEQRAIAAYLDRETAKIDALVGKVRQVIEKLQEYRTALISAAVTGKIDVRDL